VSRRREYSRDAKQSNEIGAQQSDAALPDANPAQTGLAERCKNVQGKTACCGTKLAQPIQRKFRLEWMIIIVGMLAVAAYALSRDEHTSRAIREGLIWIATGDRPGYNDGD
jgi:hypothetical protein